VWKSQNVQDRLRANKYLRKIKVNLRPKVGIFISTYLNADVVLQRHLANGGERTQLRKIVDRS